MWVLFKESVVLTDHYCWPLFALINGSDIPNKYGSKSSRLGWPWATPSSLSIRFQHHVKRQILRSQMLPSLCLHFLFLSLSSPGDQFWGTGTSWQWLTQATWPSWRMTRWRRDCKSTSTSRAGMASSPLSITLLHSMNLDTNALLRPPQCDEEVWRPTRTLHFHNETREALLLPTWFRVGSVGK